MSIAQVPYGIFDLDSRTLTIGYADKLPEGAKELYPDDGNLLFATESMNLLGLMDAWYFAETIVIDKSFAKFKPTTCYSWFDGMDELRTIKGLENINTEDVTDMGRMFSDCIHITSLDLSSFDTRKVTNMEFMFGGCINLENIYVGDKWDASKYIEEFNQETDAQILRRKTIRSIQQRRINILLQ